MIESAMKVFEQNTTFKIVTKTITDAAYGKSTPSYATSTHPAVIVPHGYSLQQVDTSIGIDSLGKIDVYVRGFTLKRDDLVSYNGRDYKVIDENKWDSTLGEFACYVCQT